MPQAQIVVLDTGGQYTHLIARKVRELGIYAEIRPSETPFETLRGCRGAIISGGPSSVYESGSPTIDAELLRSPMPVLGICYGQQLMAHLLNGKVEKGEKGEYGLARLKLLDASTRLFKGIEDHGQIWMSHRDTVSELPSGYRLLARTETCAIAAIGDDAEHKFGVQFHPEVAHTHQGARILSNFLFGVCGCEKDWDPRHRVAQIEEQIRSAAGSRSVFFFVSGGVDSTVAYTLCLRALGESRVHGTYVDTGLMRAGETEFVNGIFRSLGARAFSVEDARSRFLEALSGVREPERKRHIIGEMFVDVQQRILEAGHYLDASWVLGQGTIYPDTIESGGTAKADVIKTHHNRVAGIQKLIDEGRLVEPLNTFYKDEVRAIGQELGLPAELLQRHPFPGPGLAIRCLCSEAGYALEREGGGWILPVHSVGVQGDSRSYRPVLAIEALDHAMATELINRISRVNRVIGMAGSHEPVGTLSVRESVLCNTRLERLRAADAVVRRLSQESGFDHCIWQFPVVLIPVGTAERPDSVVLRPVDSVDGMTAQSVMIPAPLLGRMRDELLARPGISSVFLDLTHKPPATIEWE
jgi:GMP synthase (glutamine-hydrolysing)